MTFRAAVLLLGLLLLPQAAFGAVAFQAVSTAFNVTSTNTTTFAHNVGSGANRAIVVYASLAGTAQSVSSITYGGVALASKCALNITGTTGRLEVWQLIGGITFPSGSNNVVVTLSGSNSSWDVAAVSMTGALSSGTCFSSNLGGVSSGGVTVTGGVGGDLVLHGSISTVNNVGTVTATSRWSDNLNATNTEGGTTAGAPSVAITHTWDGTSVGKGIIALNIAQTAPDTTPPTDPTGLQASVTGTETLDLTWTASTDNVGITNYRVERSPSGCAAFAEVGQPLANSFTAGGLTASTGYCFRVRAWDSANFSGYSNTVQPTTLAPRTATLNWQDNSPNAGNPTTETGFQIERCTGAACSNFAILATLAQNVTTYVDTLSPIPTAGYRVTAVPSGAGYTNIAYSQPVNPPAVLSVFPASLTFASTVGINPATQQLQISNGGSPAMNWTIADDAVWVVVSPSSGTDGAVVTVSVNVAGLSSGTQFATITVTAPGANGSPVQVPLTLNLSPVTAPTAGSGGRIR